MFYKQVSREQLTGRFHQTAYLAGLGESLNALQSSLHALCLEELGNTDCHEGIQVCFQKVLGDGEASCTQKSLQAVLTFHTVTVLSPLFTCIFTWQNELTYLPNTPPVGGGGGQRFRECLAAELTCVQVDLKNSRPDPDVSSRIDEHPLSCSSYDLSGFPKQQLLSVPQI